MLISEYVAFGQIIRKRKKKKTLMDYNEWKRPKKKTKIIHNKRRRGVKE